MVKGYIFSNGDSHSVVQGYGLWVRACNLSLIFQVELYKLQIVSIFDFKSLFSNYTDKWNTNIGIYIYVYEINRTNCRVKQRL